VRAIPTPRRRRQAPGRVTTALAREMVGFIWAIAARVQPQPAA
jgi:hypothetical protein